MTDMARIFAGILAVALGVGLIHDHAGYVDLLGAFLVVWGLVTLTRIGT